MESPFSDKKVLALFDAIDAMGDLCQDYWICNGTLLGVVRDGELIPWDVDVDIGVFGKYFDKQRAIAVFRRRGFALHSDGAGSDYVSFEKYETKVDINIFAERAGQYVSLWRVVRRSIFARALHKVLRTAGNGGRLLMRLLDSLVYTKEGYSCSLETLLTFVELNFHGRRVRVPEQFERVLEWTYGPSWRTPNRAYDWRSEGANNVRG